MVACGDGDLDTGETCDDGGVASGDGCSDQCGVESGWSCSGEPSVCVCTAVASGDVVVDAAPRYQTMPGWEAAAQAWQRYLDLGPSGPRSDRVRKLLRQM